MAANGANGLAKEIEKKLLRFYGVTPEEAEDKQMYEALALICRDEMQARREEFSQKGREQGCKTVYYLCMEFLLGRSLKNSLYNLNMTQSAKEALAAWDFSLEKLYDCEPDAGLGNGGLGRLAACYLDALATQGYPATGYSILYEYGIFTQKLVDGWQTEMPDFWLPGGRVWLVPREDEAVCVQFEGTLQESWDGSYHQVELVDAHTVKAVPHDLYVAGKDGKGVSLLRLWSATADAMDMAMFNQGDYLRAVEKQAMAEIISKQLYPADNHPEGKSLRLRQQYFLVSASVQDILKSHIRRFGSADSLPERAALHINDTHPAMAIPELMRLLLDECGYSWDGAWSIVTKTFAYTNHTVMKEALECWQEELVSRLMPRLYDIIKEIDNRLRKEVWEKTQDAGLVERVAILADGVVRMANLCVRTCHHVNGVSALHSEILKKDVFSDMYSLTPAKFGNVTNGIAHRRWLNQSNPRLAGFLSELIGDDYVLHGEALEKLAAYRDDASVLAKLAEIKQLNKRDFARRIQKQSGIVLDPDSLFDVQVKRLHEYKRQHLNAFQILARYLAIKDNPSGPWVPHTYLFAAKAAPSYFIAKKIISFICALGELCAKDPQVAPYMQVVYLENYSVTMAEELMPAAELSEQISLAGTEASGTGNMKLMLNGAITIGTLDGANVEILEAVDEENILLFGMRERDVVELQRRGYEPTRYYNNNAELRRLLDFANQSGIAGQIFRELTEAIKNWDPYMVLADYADYSRVRGNAERLWTDSLAWNRMSLANIAGAGRFAADRAVREYADGIWKTGKVRF
ncbi:MAG: glycogen/starch/alpha-glucan phosphorylase [Oscillospiraceae bacterium]|jgi:starch phosphorylase|nr:glycogen/starch/alpha-glucan phosphorylase [Oscillospiraceae bacterium]